MSNKLKYEIIVKKLCANPRVLNVYDWGGRVYGVFNEKSDYDLIAIVEDDFEEVFEYEGVSVNIYKVSEWKEMEEKNSIEVLECYFLHWDNVHKVTRSINCTLKPLEIRKTISATASNAWSKGKKKLTVEKDFNPYIAKKSIWHVYRILLFGIQLMEHGEIIDYSIANDRYEEIVLNESDEWLFFKEKYQPIFNNIKTKFRKYTEKEWQSYKMSEAINQKNMPSAD